MSQPVFPALKGLGWSTHKRPGFSTRVARHVSGREIRAANYAAPLWEFELTYELLTDAGVADDLRTLMGFYLQRRGMYDGFLYLDPTDNTAAGQVIGIGDGLTSQFTLVRALGGFVEAVGQAVAPPVISVAGTVVDESGNWALQPPNQIVFVTPPAEGAAITADFNFYYACRFVDDVQDYENFMYQLWTLQSCKFTSIKP